MSLFNVAFTENKFQIEGEKNEYQIASSKQMFNKYNKNLFQKRNSKAYNRASKFIKDGK